MATPTSVRLTSYPGPVEWVIPCVAVDFWCGDTFVGTVFPEVVASKQGAVGTIIVDGMSAERNHSGLSFKLIRGGRRGS